MTTNQPLTEIFQSATFYDCLNKPVATALQGADGTFTTGLTQSTNWAGVAVPAFNWPALPATLMALVGHDSRENRAVSIDGKGNVVLQIFDGAGVSRRRADLLTRDAASDFSVLPSCA